jgi:biotin carboxylase
MTEHEKNSYVLIVGASELVMPAYHIAREELGLGVIALDYDSEAPGMRYADYSIQVSTKDVPAAVNAAKQASRKFPISGVFTAGADVEITVAAIAEALSLPGISLEVAERCNDKLKMHAFLDTKSFQAKARYKVVNSAEETQQAVHEIGLPCVLKPLDNCASRGVQRVDSLNDLTDAYKLAASNNGGRGGEVLVEECLQGTKHTVEMIVWKGQWHLLSIIDTHYISPRWPCETGLNTTMQSLEMQEKMFSFSRDLSRLIGIDFGAHKVDINIGENGEISLIELTARLSGGFHCQYASPIAFGSHDIRAALRLAVGQPLDMKDIEHKWNRGSAVRAVFPAPGIVSSIASLDKVRSVRGVKEVFVWCKQGDKVGPYHNSADRVAFVIAEGKTTEEAIENADNARNALNIETA